MNEGIIDNVKDYYGKVLQSNQDLKTNACALNQQGPVRKDVKEALQLCHEEVVTRYFGCGLVFPSAVKGLKALDFGSGAGRDCFIMSKLVGKEGFVTGVDMTKEQIDIATKYIPYHMEKFGYTQPNVDFKLGYIENLQEAGIPDKSCDLIISNCVINLTSDKPAVFKEAFRVLKDGGEMYFSDVYADSHLPENVKSHQELWGEGFAGALHWGSFVELIKDIGFDGPFLADSRNMVCKKEELQKLLGEAKFVFATCRLFKAKKSEEKNELCVKYKGTLPECPEKIFFDYKHTFDCNFQPVPSDIAMAIKQSRYSPYFLFQEAKPGSTCNTTTCEPNDPFALANKDQSACCEKQKKTCCS